MIKLEGRMQRIGRLKWMLLGGWLLVLWMGHLQPAPAAGGSLKNAQSAFTFHAVSLDETGEAMTPQRSGARAILLSLILPGAGEWSLGHRRMAKIFLGAEVALWAGYFGSLAYAEVLRRDYQTFAALHAGVNPAGKDDQYWIDIGNANNIYDFNEKRLVQRNLDAVYMNTREYYWQWDAEENRYRYVDLRLKQHRWKRRATFVIGGMILNRILSTVDVIRIIRKEKKERETGRRAMLFSSYFWHPARGDVVQLHFTWTF
ncbi:MAG: hypothetical protein GXO78_14325 [Calditrichaeota bacterium]|nr:hypothetical protein [Calditrichota bacterium]